jgi:hypothetical protein
MTADLIARLRAALDTDEATARAAFGKWGGVEGTDWIIEVGLPLEEWQPPGYGNNLGSIRLEEHRKHIIRHDPLAVLTDIVAKRKLIARGGPFCNGRCDDPDSPPMDPDTDWTTPLEHHLDCGALEAAQLIAEAYGVTAD